MYTIYTLEDQRFSGFDSIRYVGLTKDAYARFAQHLQCADDNEEKNIWIRDLKSAGIMLIMRTVETVETLEEAREQEAYWIQQYLKQGVRLLNRHIPLHLTLTDLRTAFNLSFRLGDRVRLVKDNNPNTLQGEIGSIGLLLKHDASALWVEFDNGYKYWVDTDLLAHQKSTK